MFGPTSFFISHDGGYFVIYSLPDGNTYVAELNGSYQVVGESRFLGHQVSFLNRMRLRLFCTVD